MAVRIGDTEMTSDLTPHTCRWRPHAAADGGGAWVATLCPGRLLSRDEATTAMCLAEAEATGRGRTPQAAQWRRELAIW